MRRQIRYGEERGVPWGISEAAYNARDVNFTYQYSNFGVSGLGLKRGLSEDLVVAPYATALAAMVDPLAAAGELRAPRVDRRARAITASTSRSTTRRRACPRASRSRSSRAYMAHHQGMTIVALANVLLESTMRRRFDADPAVQATDLLLQERTPRTVTVARPCPPSRMRGHVRDEVPPGPAALSLAARPDAPHAPAVQRALLA